MTTTARPTTGHTLSHLPTLSSPYMGGDYQYAAIAYRDRVWVICTEGVGWEVTDETPWETRDGRTLTRTEVAALIAAQRADKDSNDAYELEGWVRSFGSRLEGNFHLWSRTLDIARDDLHESECGDLHASASLKDSHERTCQWCAEARTYSADEVLDDINVLLQPVGWN